MKSKKIARKSAYAVRFELGENINEALEGFAAKHKLGFCEVQLIGAVKNTKLRYLDVKTGKMKVDTFPESMELIAQGNISINDNKPFAHIHGFIGYPDKGLRGGHIISAEVSVTVEGVLQEFDKKITRIMDPVVNCPIFDL